MHMIYYYDIICKTKNKSHLLLPQYSALLPTLVPLISTVSLNPALFLRGQIPKFNKQKPKINTGGGGVKKLIDEK